MLSYTQTAATPCRCSKALRWPLLTDAEETQLQSGPGLNADKPATSSRAPYLRVGRERTYARSPRTVSRHLHHFSALTKLLAEKYLAARCVAVMPYGEQVPARLARLGKLP